MGETSSLTRCKSDFFVPTFGLSAAAIVAILVGAVLLYVALLFALFYSKRQNDDKNAKTVTVVEQTSTASAPGKAAPTAAPQGAKKDTKLAASTGGAQARLAEQDRALSATASIKA